MVVIFVAIVLFIINSAVATSINGVSTSGAAYIYWILGFITFLIPGAIVTGQLGLMFPGEGAVIIGVIAFSFFLSILRFRITQNFVNIIFPLWFDNSRPAGYRSTLEYGC